MPHFENVPLSSLSIDEKINVRRTGKGSEPAFVASIRAKGVIEPMTVRKSGDGYTITNGGKRFAALTWMREKGEITPEYMVPVSIREESDRDARETSLMTNIVRADMHPVDEYEAVADLIAEGMSIPEIAERYAISEKGVRQRLALGQLSPKVREAWRSGQIGNETAMAFTLASSVKEQDKVLESGLKDRWALSAHNLRTRFRSKERDLGKLIAFVGIDDLRASGVKIEEDLFGIDHRSPDPKAVAAKAAEKLEAECQKLRDMGWSFAITTDDPQAANRYTWSRISYGRKGKPTAKEKARIGELEAIIRADDGGGETPPEVAEAEIELAVIREAVEARAYSKNEMAQAGCVLSIDHNGKLSIDCGLMKPAQAKKVKAEQKKKDKAAGSDTGPVLSSAVVFDLSAKLTAAAGLAIRKDPDLALRLALAAISGPGYGPIKISISGMLAERGRDVEFADAFHSAMTMPTEDVARSLAMYVGHAFDFRYSSADRNPFEEDGDDTAAICNALPVDAMKEALIQSFDAADFFKRVPAAVITDAIAEFVNEDEARRVGKLKKAEIVKFATDNVVGTGWLPKQLRTAHYDGPGAAKGAPPAELTAAGKAKRPRREKA